jgi:ribosomal protein S18 acetylase RimI-like enzyme
MSASEEFSVGSLRENAEERAQFSCGIEPLDRYFHHQASQDARRKVAGVYVLREIATNKIAGYYTLSSFGINIEKLPSDISRKLPRYPKLPATLMGRLAIDAQFQGKKLGHLLLFDAMFRAWKVADEIGSVVFVVDAKNDKARLFYERYGFRLLIESELQLFISMEEIGKKLKK